MSKRKYPQVYAGQIVSPLMAPHSYRAKCCDCGLVHRFVFRVLKLTKRKKDGYWEGKPAKGYKILFKAYRDERATAAGRRKRKSG